MTTYTDMATILPEGERGEAKVKHYTISPQEASFSRVRMAVTGGREQPADEGTYAQLFVNGSLVMSDTQMERDSNRIFVYEARGDVLVAGLGVGLILLPILASKRVESVTVIEKCQDVIDLVEPHIRKKAGGNKLTVVCADIFDWKPPRGSHYDVIYFDIWGDICTDNLKGITKLHAKFRHRKRTGGWMGSWMQHRLRRGW